MNARHCGGATGAVTTRGSDPVGCAERRPSATVLVAFAAGADLPDPMRNISPARAMGVGVSQVSSWYGLCSIPRHARDLAFEIMTTDKKTGARSWRISRLD